VIVVLAQAAHRDSLAVGLQFSSNIAMLAAVVSLDREATVRNQALTQVYAFCSSFLGSVSETKKGSEDKVPNTPIVTTIIRASSKLRFVDTETGELGERYLVCAAGHSILLQKSLGVVHILVPTVA
jgi:hypothetical protein